MLLLLGSSKNILVRCERILDFVKKNLMFEKINLHHKKINHSEKESEIKIDKYKFENVMKKKNSNTRAKDLKDCKEYTCIIRRAKIIMANKFTEETGKAILCTKNKKKDSMTILTAGS